jgi:hypothetical protein
MGSNYRTGKRVHPIQDSVASEFLVHFRCVDLEVLIRVSVCMTCNRIGFGFRERTICILPLIDNSDHVFIQVLSGRSEEQC